MADRIQGDMVAELSLNRWRDPLATRTTMISSVLMMSVLGIFIGFLDLLKFSFFSIRDLTYFVDEPVACVPQAGELGVIWNNSMWNL